MLTTPPEGTLKSGMPGRDSGGLPSEDGSGRLALPRSKTDQEGKGETLYVCRVTMTAIDAWRRAAGIVSGPLFRAVSKDGATVAETPLSVSAIRSVIRRLPVGPPTTADQA